MSFQPLKQIALVAVGLNAANFGGCAQLATQNTSASATTCFKEARSSPAGVIVYKRVWANDETDTADKLRDPKPLTKEEQNALVELHNKALPCRQIVIAHDNQFAAWETPYWQDAFQRQDAIFYKLASGEMPVGLANKQMIENLNKFRADSSRARADAVRIEETQRQQAAAAIAAGLADGLERAGQSYSPPPQPTNAPPPAGAAPIIPSCAVGYRCNGRIQQADGVWR